MMIRIAVLCSLLFLLVPCAGSAGPERIVCPAEPEQGRETWELEEVWRAGDDAEGDVIFGTISQALIDEEGRTYVLDAQLAQIEVFDPAGAHVATLGGRGEGPGEFRIPLDMVFLPGGALGVAEVFPGKLTVVARDGTPLRAIDLQRDGSGGFIQLMSCHAGGGHLVVGGQDVGADESGERVRTNILQSHAPDGSMRYRLWEEIQATDDGPGFALDEKLTDYINERLTVLDDGRVVMNRPRDRFELSVYAADGELERVIEIPRRPWRRDERARRRCRAWLEGMAASEPEGTPVRLRDTEPVVDQILTGPDGLVWVLTSEARWNPRPGVLASYDVFTPEGRYLKVVDVRGEGRPASDQLVFGPDGAVVRIAGYAEAMMTLLVRGVMDWADEDVEPLAVVGCRRRS